MNNNTTANKNTAASNIAASNSAASNSAASNIAASNSAASNSAASNSAANNSAANNSAASATAASNTANTKTTAANTTIFRDKSIEKMSSPDKLDDYIRLSNPGVWFILTAVALILVGAIIFGSVGHIDSVVPGVGISDNGKMTCLVKKEYGSRFTSDMTARIDDKTYDITLRSNAPVTVWDSTGAYALSVGNMQPGEWVYELDVDGTFTDGAYDVKIITERISPLSFLFSDQ